MTNCGDRDCWECNPPDDGWIPVSERLPHDDGRYAVVYVQGNVRRRFIADYLVIEKRWTNTLDAEITHWYELLPLPEPPEEE